jgi:molybdopterin converting factor small subunit
MHVTVVFTTQIKAALGTVQEQVAIDAGSTVQSVLQTLQRKHSEVFSQLVFDQQGSLLPSLLICVNDQQVTSPANHGMTDGDTVTLLSAISGG